MKTRQAMRLGMSAATVTMAAVATFSAAMMAPAIAKSPAMASAAASMNKPDPEVMLIEVYKELGANRLRHALTKADKLVELYPNFRLGHLVRGDLLLMQTHRVATFGAVSGQDEKLKNLREEAIVRLKSLRERPDPDLVPRSILQLRPDQKHALVVDARRSRLYVYENRNGELKFSADYYISQGKLGVNKLKEGDQKTPIGVYYITGRLSGERLPDFYGSGALPINYPNEWDKINGRSGSGIWLHGTPSDSFSRPPLSSDGCVVLTNPDLYRISNSIEIGKTPIVISESIEFVNRTKWENDRSMAARLLDNWRRDLESMNAMRVAGHYSKQFRSDRNETFDGWIGKQQQSLRGVSELSIVLRDVTHFLYPGRDDMLVSTFTQDSFVGKSRSTLRKRQYWAREGAQWKIVFETTI
jgi:murein L,D-transpeptidase YafK